MKIVLTVLIWALCDPPMGFMFFSYSYHINPFLGTITLCMQYIDEIVPFKFVRSKNGKVFKLSNSWRNLVPRSFRCLYMLILP